ncbi:MAG: hypothetical protein Q9163_006411 [Psora crenata]
MPAHTQASDGYIRGGDTELLASSAKTLDDGAGETDREGRDWSGRWTGYRGPRRARPHGPFKGFVEMPTRELTSFDDQATRATRDEVRQSGPKASCRTIPHTNDGKKRKRTTPESNHHIPSKPCLAPAESHGKLPSTPKLYSQSQKQLQISPRTLSPGPQAVATSHPDKRETNGKSLSAQAQSQLKARAKALLPQRKALPIWSNAASIRRGLRWKDIMLLVGETGSGKSTQLPQMLVQEPWFRARTVKVRSKDGVSTGAGNASVGGCVAVTEPRRVAAISLARRVAEEIGSPLGASHPASRVGYSVRFDNSTGPATQIKYLTEGMLLQEMLRDPWLRQYSAVVVDEVHERGVNVDLVLGFLRRMVVGKEGLEERGGVPLKVVVMSATAEVGKLLEYFWEKEQTQKDQMKHGNTTSISTEKGSGSESEWSGISSSVEDDRDGERHKIGSILGSNANGMAPQDAEAQSNDSRYSKIPPNVSLCHIEGRQYPVQTHYTPTPVQDYVDAALRTIFQIHHKEPMPGDILVFLTGQEVVESLERLANEYALGLSSEVPRMLVLPLFAALPQAAQQRVFQPAPPKTRKVILATNIAETSVTVSGVRYVIDCGKAKIKHFRTRIGLESLLVKPISKSAAIQRKGRAGREAPGHCYRLYTEEGYLGLEQFNLPEILRCDLSHAILTMKARGVNDVGTFPFLDKPPRNALEKALLLLLRLGALTDRGTINEIGLQMARLPLSVQLGRTLIAAAPPNYDCEEEVVDIISCLSVENVFLTITSEEKREAAETARRDLYRREGDHLTLLATVHAYAAERTDRKAWCDRHFVSHRAMRAVMDVRKQLRSHLHLGPTTTPEGQTTQQTTSHEKATLILRAFLAGFAMNTARLFPDGRYKTVVGHQTGTYLIRAPPPPPPLTQERKKLQPARIPSGRYGYQNFIQRIEPLQFSSSMAGNHF